MKGKAAAVLLSSKKWNERKRYSEGRKLRGKNLPRDARMFLARI